MRLASPAPGRDCTPRSVVRAAGAVNAWERSMRGQHRRLRVQLSARQDTLASVERVGVLVVGGGIVGTGIAWSLAARGVEDIVVIDLDLAGLYASSELNAGGARATWWQPVNIETCRATLDFFRGHAAEVGFREHGYLWLYADDGLWERAVAKRALQNAHGLGVELLTPADVWARFPLLDRARDEIVGATFSPRDGLVNPNAVRALYRDQARALGVQFRNRHYVAGVATAQSVGAAGALRRVAHVDVVEVEPGDPTDSAGILREILTTHRVPAGARRASPATRSSTAWAPGRPSSFPRSACVTSPSRCAGRSRSSTSAGAICRRAPTSTDSA